MERWFVVGTFYYSSSGEGKNTIQFDVVTSIEAIRRDVLDYLQIIKLPPTIREVSLKNLDKVEGVKKEVTKEGNYVRITVTFKKGTKRISNEIVLSDFNQPWRKITEEYNTPLEK